MIIRSNNAIIQPITEIRNFKLIRLVEEAFTGNFKLIQLVPQIFSVVTVNFDKLTLFDRKGSVPKVGLDNVELDSSSKEKILRWGCLKWNLIYHIKENIYS